MRLGRGYIGPVILRNRPPDEPVPPPTPVVDVQASHGYAGDWLAIQPHDPHLEERLDNDAELVRVLQMLDLV